MLMELAIVIMRSNTFDVFDVVLQEPREGDFCNASTIPFHRPFARLAAIRP